MNKSTKFFLNIIVAMTFGFVVATLAALVAKVFVNIMAWMGAEPIAVVLGYYMVQGIIIGAAFLPACQAADTVVAYCEGLLENMQARRAGLAA